MVKPVSQIPGFTIQSIVLPLRKLSSQSCISSFLHVSQLQERSFLKSPNLSLKKLVGGRPKRGLSSSITRILLKRLIWRSPCAFSWLCNPFNYKVLDHFIVNTALEKDWVRDKNSKKCTRLKKKVMKKEHNWPPDKQSSVQNVKYAAEYMKIILQTLKRRQWNKNSYKGTCES